MNAVVLFVALAISFYGCHRTAIFNSCTTLLSDANVELDLALGFMKKRQNALADPHLVAASNIYREWTKQCGTTASK